MRHIRQNLKQSNLFAGIGDKGIYEILQGIRYRVSSFSAGQVVALEGATCMHLAIMVSGSVKIQRIYPSGRTLTMERLRPGAVFGEVIIFSQHRRYPATVTVAEDETRIMFIPREEVVKLCYSHPRFLENFLGILSEKILTLNRRVKFLSQPSIRGKVVSYLLDQYREQDTQQLKLKRSRREMASELGIPRPSLSRELGRMKEEELIDFRRNVVQIRDLPALQEFLDE